MKMALPRLNELKNENNVVIATSTNTTNTPIQLVTAPVATTKTVVKATNVEVDVNDPKVVAAVNKAKAQGKLVVEL